MATDRATPSHTVLQSSRERVNLNHHPEVAEGDEERYRSRDGERLVLVGVEEEPALHPEADRRRAEADDDVAQDDEASDESDVLHGLCCSLSGASCRACGFWSRPDPAWGRAAWCCCQPRRTEGRGSETHRIWRPR